MLHRCAQVKVTGGGSAVPSDTVKFPGAYKQTDPEVNFSIWGGMKDYPMPGPAVYVAGGASGRSGDAPNATEPITETAPVESVAPIASTAAAHTDENCGGLKKFASNSRVYRALMRM